MPTTLLEPTTSAAQSDQFSVDNNELPVHVYSETLGTGETGVIQIKVAGSWQNYVDAASTKQLDEDNTGVAIYAPGVYRVDKSATASATGIYMSTGTKE